MAAFTNVRWPRDLCPQSCVFTRSRNDVRQQSPRTRSDFIITNGRPLWFADCTFKFSNGSKLAKLRYWLEKLEGLKGSVQVWDFNSPYPYGIDFGFGALSLYERHTLWTNAGTQYGYTWAGLPSHWVGGAVVMADGAAAIGDTTIDLKGLQPSKPACILGQYIQVGRRLYLCAADTVADGAGKATIELTSALISAVADGDTVRLVEAACEMRMTSQEWPQSGDTSGPVSVRVTFEETVQDVG